MASRTDRKSLLALRSVGPESEAESVRFHGRRVIRLKDRFLKQPRQLDLGINGIARLCNSNESLYPFVTGSSGKFDHLPIPCRRQGGILVSRWAIYNRRGCLVLALKFSCKKFSAAFQPSFFEQRGLFSVRGDRRERATKKLIAIRPRMLGG